LETDEFQATSRRFVIILGRLRIEYNSTQNTHEDFFFVWRRTETQNLLLVKETHKIVSNNL